MSLFTVLSKEVSKNIGNLIKRTNQRLFEIAKNFGTESAIYQDNINKIESILGIDMKVSTRKSKGVEISLYQIPNNIKNKEIISDNSKKYRDFDNRQKTASKLLGSVDWVSDVRKKYKSKAKKEGNTSKNEIDNYIRKYQSEYIPLLREKMQLFYRHNFSNSLKPMIDGLSLEEKINFLRSLDANKELPTTVQEAKEIRELLQRQGRNI